MTKETPRIDFGGASTRRPALRATGAGRGDPRFSERGDTLAFADPVPVNLSLGQVRIINPILTTVALGYRNPQFVGEVLFPRVPVDIRGGQILQFGKEDFKSYNLRRAPGGTTQRVNFGYLGDPFALVQDSVEMPVPREYQQDAERMPGIDLGSRAVRRSMNIVLKSLEVDQAAMAVNPANYAGGSQSTLSGTSQWSNAASDPVGQILGYKETVRAQTGMYPNVMVLGPAPWIALRNNPVVKQRYQYTTPDAITEDMIAKLLELDKIAVGRSITSDDGGVFSDIWGDNAVLAYSPRELSAVEEPAFGYTYTYAGTPYAEVPYWDARAKAWVYGVTMDRVPVLTGIAAGYLIINPS